ncbi:MAG: hypothetical protein RLZZ292_2516 [Bacteroidota bacterium]
MGKELLRNIITGAILNQLLCILRKASVISRANFACLLPKNCVKFFVQRAALNSKFALFLAKILHEILALLISSSFLSKKITQKQPNLALRFGCFFAFLHTTTNSLSQFSVQFPNFLGTRPKNGLCLLLPQILCIYYRFFWHRLALKVNRQYYRNLRLL